MKGQRRARLNISGYNSWRIRFYFKNDDDDDGSLVRLRGRKQKAAGAIYICNMFFSVGVNPDLGRTYWHVSHF